MKKKTSLILSAALAANIIAYSGLQVAETYADESTAQEAVSRLDNRNAKKEEILPSILKPGVPEQFVLEIDSYKDALSKIEKDFGKEVNIPAFIGSHRAALKGKIGKGVGVALYKLDEKDVSAKKFTPDNENLISDSKFTITSDDGSFLLPFKNEGIKPGEHIGICISYSVKDSEGKVLNKTYAVDSIYVGINPQNTKVGGTVDVNSLITGVPAGTEIEVANDFDTKTPGTKEIRLNLKYDGNTSTVSIPVIVAGNSAEAGVENSFRVSGKNRFETNLESVKKNFKEGQFDTVIIASGHSFADPLAAGPLAMKLKAPVIFSDNSGLSAQAQDFIKKSQVKKVIIVGGENTVPANVEKQIAGAAIERIAGRNRYETSKMIAEKYGNSAHVIFTDGRNFADALSATPLSKKINAPVILVKNIGSIPENVNNYRDAYIIGGKKSVSEGVEIALKNAMSGKKVYRIYGQNRSATSAQVSELVKFNQNIIANGNSFADALSSINMLNSEGKNLLLIGSHRVSDEIKALMEGKTNYIVGGYSTVSKSVLGY